MDFHLFFVLRQESIKFAQMSSSERPETRRLHESPYDKEDLPIGETRGLVALMPLGESHHRFVNSP